MTKKKRQKAKKGLSATVTGRELAKLLGCDPSSITRLRDRPGFPVPANSKSGRAGRYELRAIISWLWTSRSSAVSAREWVYRERADSLAMDNAERRGELLQAEQVGEFLAAIMEQLKAALQNLPKRCGGVLAGMTDPALVSSHLRHEVRAIQTELAASIRRYQTAGDRQHGVTASPEKKASKKKAVKKKRAAKKKATRKTNTKRRN